MSIPSQSSLQQAINNLGELNLTLALMDNSPAFAQFLAVFGLDSLQISAAEVAAYPDDGDNFYVTGSIGLWGQSLDDMALYFIIPENPQTFAFQLSATFGQLSIGQLIAANVLILNGINNINDLLSANFEATQLIYDSVEYNLYFGNFEPTTPVNLPASAIGFALANVGFEIANKYLTQQQSWNLYAQLVFGNTMVDTQIELPTGTLFANRYWIFRITESLLLGEGFADLLLFLSGANLGGLIGTFENNLPPQLNRIPAFIMYGMELHYDPTACAYQLISFSTVSSYPFVIVEDYFSIESLGFDLLFTLDTAPPKFTLTLFGSFSVSDDLSFDMSLYISSDTQEDWILAMQGEIDLGHITTLNALPSNTPLNDFQLPAGMLVANSIKLNDFNFQFNPFSQVVDNVTLDLEFDAVLQLVPNVFSIQMPRLKASVSNPFNQGEGATPRQIEASIQAYIVLGQGSESEPNDNNIVFNAAAFKHVNGWEFSGDTLEGQQIAIAQFIQQLAANFGVDASIPAPLQGLEIDKISVSFNTETNHFSFVAEVEFPVQEITFDATISIDVIQQTDGSYRKTFSGQLMLEEGDELQLEFDLIFSEEPSDAYFLATYHDSVGGQVNVQQLVACLTGSGWAGTWIPSSLEIGLQDALIGFADSQSQGYSLVFGVDIAAGANLSNLPLIGQKLPPDVTLQLVFQLVIATSDVTVAEVNRFNALLPPDNTPLPKASGASADGDTAIAEGFDLVTCLMLGNYSASFDLPVAIDGGGNMVPSTQAPAGNQAMLQLDTAGDLKSITWFKLQKNFGPVYLDKIGGTVGYDDNRLSAIFSLYGSVSEAGLSLSLDGLTVYVGLTASSPITDFDVRFDLLGIGIEYKQTPLEIGASLLHTTGTLNGVSYDEYDGAAMLSMPGLTLGALASYAEINHVPSLFLYGVLDTPIGGPGFLFVDGLSAGFGFNRNLIIPDINHVTSFPLVAAAGSGVTSTSPADLNAMMLQMQAVIPPMLGEYFLAMGVRFSTYGLIDSLVLLTVMVGERIEVDVLGLSTATLPPPAVELDVPVSPLAELQLALEGRFVPDQGYVSIEGGLTPACFVLSRDCHITGGFAMYAWFNGIYAGDFVLTLGGYHPGFPLQDHPNYPRMAPLGLNWQILPELAIKGNIYAALVPSALMAGGHFEVTWNSGDISAWFNADADFLLNWQPYFYRTALSVDVGASYTFSVLGLSKTVSFDVGADLALWGPDFSGKVHIDYTLVSFTIEFGAAAAEAPQPLQQWDDFAGAFLPPAAQVIGVSVQSGQVALPVNDADTGDFGIVNPQNLCLLLNSAIPSKTVFLNGTALPLASADSAFGVAPMDLDASRVGCELSITLSWDNLPVPANTFTLMAVYKSLPTALWGGSLAIDLQGDSLLDGLLCGYRIVPFAVPNPAPSQQIDTEKLQLSNDPINNAYAWSQVTAVIPTDEADSARRATIADTLTSSAVAATRRGILDAVGLDDLVVDLDSTVAEEFVDAPQIAA
ncbi:MAG: hypothetical protein PHR16_15575 [Methylovulum sp.]|nr:hypothetical protein [Methylovulum sp.]